MNRIFYMIAVASTMGGCCARPAPPAYHPNHATTHEENLRWGIQRSLDRQEKMDRVNDLYMPMKD